MQIIKYKKSSPMMQFVKFSERKPTENKKYYFVKAGEHGHKMICYFNDGMFYETDKHHSSMAWLWHEDEIEWLDESAIPEILVISSVEQLSEEEKKYILDIMHS